MGAVHPNGLEGEVRREEVLAGAQTDATAIAAIAVGASKPKQLDLTEKYSVLVPAGARVEILDLDAHLPRPSRAKGIYRPATVDALIDHVKRHEDLLHTTVWVHPTAGRITAVLNDHAGDGETGWRDHRSELTLTPTEEWQFWLASDGQLMSQTQFAAHIEDGLREIVEPAAADMLELAQTFHAHQTAAFRSATRLHSGVVQVRYDEEVEATAGQSGEMSVPTEFKLSIAPFLGEDPWGVTARLRYRLNRGELKLGYKLDRPSQIVRETLNGIADRLTTHFTVFIGEPPSA